MDNAKTGAFIAELRKELGSTQKELADKIGVTDKAVSKWERGRGFPDVAILEILAKELGVSVTELINGERSTPETLKAQSDSALIETLLYVKQMGRKTLGTLLLILGACMLCSPLFFAGNSAPLFVIGIFAIVGGIFMIKSKKAFILFNMPKTVLEWISLGALAAAVVLELLPNGVVLLWGTPSGEPLRETCSYFDPLPYGVGMFPPFITALLTAAVAVFSVIVMLIGKQKPKNALFVCIIVTTVISACPVLYGFERVTVIGVLITLMLALSAVFRAAANAKC
ncbi:MAG: helix-turn-helix transcriptional regulator [Ruminococcaceae bacterium]|nr:helix-turn-helix transcriptional regulator [Oscillospiraceae bacterium]